MARVLNLIKSIDLDILVMGPQPIEQFGLMHHGLQGTIHEAVTPSVDDYSTMWSEH
jgi:hypothetical protein